MKRFQPAWLLLALALIGGQWLAVAHSAEHTSVQADDVLCVQCVQAHNLEQAQTHHTPVLEAVQTSFPPISQVRTRVTTALHETPNIRAPPHAIC